MVIAGIGYQGRTIDDLMEAVRQASITAVIDVRELPWSRRADFSKKRLSDRLTREGVRYVHLRAAGNPRENRRTAKSPDECLTRYRQHLAQMPQVLDEILAEAAGERVALLCFEADWEECHRSILLEQLASLRPDLEVLAL